MENRKIQFRSKACNLHLSAYPGHFATKHSHVNYFLDMTTLKVRQSNAEEAARALVPLYKHNTVVDTIVCLDGTEVIGEFLAEKLTESGFFSYNQHKSIYIVSSSDGQMFFINIQPMIKTENIVYFCGICLASGSQSAELGMYLSTMIASNCEISLMLVLSEYGSLPY